MSVILRIDLGRAGEARDYYRFFCNGKLVTYKVVRRTDGVDVFFWEQTNSAGKFRFLRVWEGKTSAEVVTRFKRIYHCGGARRL